MYNREVTQWWRERILVVMDQFPEGIEQMLADDKWIRLSAAGGGLEVNFDF